MANLKRYEPNSDESNMFSMEQDVDGEWVKFDDIKELLNTSTNNLKAKILTLYREYFEKLPTKSEYDLYYLMENLLLELKELSAV